MNLDRVTAGKNAPDEINVIVEIPINGPPVKYELNKETGAMFVDRFLNTSMHYPCNYGYIPKTLAKDGDPVDVIIKTPMSIIPGAVMPCRPVGVLKMTDEAGDDSKILAVPLDSVSKFSRDVQSYEDLKPALLNLITHFFEHYKDLEPNKWVKVDGWYGPEEAKQEIVESMQAYSESGEELHF
ncbi:MAG: inorganic diphosphatase [Gammaproteobacteria bacterium]